MTLSHGPVRLIRRSILILGLSGAVALAACGGTATAAPTLAPGQTASPDQSLDTGSTQEPGAGPTADGGDVGNGGLAFSSASTALDALDSYVFKVEIKSDSVAAGETTSSHTIMSGQVMNKPSKASLFDNQDLDKDEVITSESAILIIGPDAWLRDGGDGQPWTAIPAEAATGFVGAMAGFRPEQVFGLYFAGLGGNFSSVGDETKNGIKTTHYQGDQQVGAVLGAIAGVQGAWTSDVWIANDGGYLVHSEASATGAATGDGGSFLITVDISQVNAAPELKPPSN